MHNLVYSSKVIGIILEEGRKMNKKILDAAVVTVFFVGLFVMSDIEGSTKGTVDTEAYSAEQSAGKTQVKESLTTLTAGVSKVLSENSFTTESDELAYIKRNQRLFVTAPQEGFDEGSIGEENATVLRTAVITGQMKDEMASQNSSEGTKTKGNGTKETEVGRAGTIEAETIKAGIIRTEVGGAETIVAETSKNRTIEAETIKAGTKGTEVGGAETVAEETNKNRTIEAETRENGTETEESEQNETYGNRWGITLTEDEIELLARIVWLEANGEPMEGQKAVVEVVFNRMASELYPNTLYDVLSQKNPVQFCSWKNREKAKPTEKEYESIRQVLYGNTQILRNDTLYFSTEPLTSNVDVRIGGHSFCY